MYDIYLSHGCRTLPNLADLVDIIPGLAHAQFTKQLIGPYPEFLGLNLPLEVARRLIERLKYSECRALGTLIPTRYRDQQAQFTPETAYPIAEKALKSQIVQYPNVEFDPIQFAREELMWYVFAASSPTWARQGLIPGALIVLVDKLDGHVWNDDEIKTLGS